MSIPYDPTIEEMREVLDGVFGINSDISEIDREQAIYWFANDYHSGQSSNLYSALSTSPYQPRKSEYGLIEYIESDGKYGPAELCYNELVSQFITETQDGT